MQCAVKLYAVDCNLSNAIQVIFFSRLIGGVPLLLLMQIHIMIRLFGGSLFD